MSDWVVAQRSRLFIAGAVGVLRARTVKRRIEGDAFTLEKQFHGNPSGLDHGVIVDGCCVRFCAQDAPRMRPLSIRPLPLVISWTPRIGTTRDAVLGVNARHQKHPELVNKIFQSMTDIVHQAEVF